MFLFRALRPIPQKKRFKTVYLVGIRKPLLFPQNTHTHKSIACLVPSKIQLQLCLEILEWITTSRDGYNKPIVVCFYRSNSGKASLAWIYRLASDKRISIFPTRLQPFFCGHTPIDFLFKCLYLFLQFALVSSICPVSLICSVSISFFPYLLSLSVMASPRGKGHYC